jgi:hypothetical protein
MKVLTRAAVVLAFASALVTVGCSSSSSSPSPFNGSWSCTQTTTYNYTSPASTQPTVVTKSLDFVFDINSGDSLVFESAPTDAATVGDGGAGCSLTYNTSGASATLESGQSCPVTATVNKATVTYTVDFSNGSASVSGNSLMASTQSTFSGTVTSGAVTIKYAGNATGSTTCTK